MFVSFKSNTSTVALVQHEKHCKRILIRHGKKQSIYIQTDFPESCACYSSAIRDKLDGNKITVRRVIS
jgi:hypothetical protein